MKKCILLLALVFLGGIAHADTIGCTGVYCNQWSALLGGTHTVTTLSNYNTLSAYDTLIVTGNPWSSAPPTAAEQAAIKAYHASGGNLIIQSESYALFCCAGAYADFPVDYLNTTLKPGLGTVAKTTGTNEWGQEYSGAQGNVCTGEDANGDPWTVWCVSGQALDLSPSENGEACLSQSPAASLFDSSIPNQTYERVIGLFLEGSYFSDTHGRFIYWHEWPNRVNERATGNSISNVFLHMQDFLMKRISPFDYDVPSCVGGNQEVDLVLTKTTATPFVAEGAWVTFQLSIFNNGPATATNVVVTDALPAGLSFVSATASVGSVTP